MRRLLISSSWRIIAGALLLVSVPLGAVALAAGVRGPATAERPPARGASVQATDTLPPPSGCERLVVIGDSLTAASNSLLSAELGAEGFTFRIDAAVSRQVSNRVPEPYSGVKAARRVRSSFGEADCWVIALGSNDIDNGAGDPHVADAVIDEMLAEVSPGALVWWVNINYRTLPGRDFDANRATTSFNAVLASRALVDDRLVVIDWYSVLAANPEWFVDEVHVRRAGSQARVALIMEALPPSTR